MADYVGLSLAVGLQEFYVGFMFLIYWSGPKKASFAELPSVAAASLFGLGLGLALQQLQSHMGGPGVLLFLAIIALVVFLLIRQRLSFLINEAAMLMLTLATVAHVQAHASFQGLFVSLGLAIAFFGLLFWLAGRFTEARSRAQPSAERTNTAL